MSDTLQHYYDTHGSRLPTNPIPKCKDDKPKRVLVTKPILSNHTDEDTAKMIIVKAIGYGITSQINGRNKDNNFQVLTEFCILELIEKIEDHMKTMRSNFVETNKTFIKTLRDISEKIEGSEDV